MSSLLPRQPPLPQCPAQLRKSLVFTITSERVLVTSPGWSLGHHGNTTSGICLLLLMRSTCGFNPWELNSAGPAAALCREGMPPMLAWATGVHRSLGPLHLRRHRHSLSATDPGGGGLPVPPTTLAGKLGPVPATGDTGRTSPLSLHFNGCAETAREVAGPSAPAA